MFTTEAAKINAPRPKHLMNKSAEEIVEYLQCHFRQEPMRDAVTRRITKWIPRNKSSAYLQAVSDALFDPEDWKNPFYARFPDCGKEWAKAAIIWYHGHEGLETFIGVQSPGYQC